MSKNSTRSSRLKASFNKCEFLERLTKIGINDKIFKDEIGIPLQTIRCWNDKKGIPLYVEKFLDIYELKIAINKVLNGAGYEIHIKETKKIEITPLAHLSEND